MALPPGPSTLPLLQTRAWLREPFPFLDRCRAEHGHTFSLRLFGYAPMVMTGDPALVHAVFTGDPAVLLAGKGNDVLVPFLGEHSLLTMDGPRHARDRRLMTPPFHGQRMRAYGAAIQAATRKAVAGWGPGELPTHATLQAVSLEVILRAVFGIEEEARLAESGAALAELLERTTPALLFLGFLRKDLGPWSPWGRYLRQRAEAERIVGGEVRRRRDTPGEDILSLLLAARDEAGAALSAEELYGELVTLLIAGHETTANALAWALGWLGSERAVHDRLVAEIDGADADPEALAKLPYLGAFCNEVLRLHPVFPIVRRVLGAPWSLGPWELPEGVSVAPCIHLVHTREDLYPEPRRFRPERFLERTYGASEFIPFGGGARRCIGAAFALYEMKIALATILRTVRLGDMPAPVPERRNLAIAPAGGARIRILERRTARAA